MTKGQNCSQKPYYGSLDNFMKNKKNIEDGVEILALKENFLPWEYDFKLEYENVEEKNFWNLCEEEDTIKRFFKYKINDTSFDCDMCKLSREIYRKLWGWEDISQKSTIMRYGCCPDLSSVISFGPDTMNSYLTVFNRLNALLEEDGLRSEKSKEIVREIRGKIRCDSALYYYTLLIDRADKKVSWSSILKDKKKMTMWKKYAAYTHTLGNFTLVPAGFNTDRNRLFGDFWDLSLAYLRSKAYDSVWTGDSLFVKYINFFFLWDYVDNKNINNYYVKSLLSNGFKEKEYKFADGHSGVCYDGFLMPTEREIYCFLDNCLWAIRRRGIFMIAMLRIALGINADESKSECCAISEQDWEVSEIYKEIMKKVFLTNNLYSGYEEVIKKIENTVHKTPDAGFVENILKDLKEKLEKENT